MFKIIIHAFQMDINCILMFMIICHFSNGQLYFNDKDHNSCISNDINCILMTKIIIHVFQMDINCILMTKIIIHAFQMDINSILMKLFHV